MIRGGTRRADYAVIAAVSITAIILIIMLFAMLCMQWAAKNEQAIIIEALTVNSEIDGGIRDNLPDLLKTLLLFLVVSIIFMGALTILVLRYIKISKHLRREQVEIRQKLASLYHNINSSLTPIMGFAEFMLKENVSVEKQILYLNSIYEKALDIRDIINNEEKKGG